MLPETLKTIPVAAAIDAWDEQAIVDGKLDRGELTLEIAAAKIAAVCDLVKREHKFVRLSGITAVDRHPAEPRFEIVYHLHAFASNQRLRLKCRAGGEKPEIGSVTGVWRNANWYEREVFDLFGVEFRGHPDLARILMPADWSGHPLRKDYPVHGHRYDYQHE